MPVFSMILRTSRLAMSVNFNISDSRYILLVPLANAVKYKDVLTIQNEAYPFLGCPNTFLK